MDDYILSKNYKQREFTKKKVCRKCTEKDTKIDKIMNEIQFIKRHILKK